MTQMVSDCLLTVEVQVSLCIQVLWLSPVSVIPPMLHIHLQHNTALSEGQAGEANKAVLFRYRRALDSKLH